MGPKHKPTTNSSPSKVSPIAQPKPSAFPETTPEIDAFAHELLGKVADKWTLLILDALEREGVLRFTQISNYVEEISQKMLTKTLRMMERDGLVERTVYAVVPPRVEYKLTSRGFSLCEAFCSVWGWVEKHHREVQKSRTKYDRTARASPKTGIRVP